MSDLAAGLDTVLANQNETFLTQQNFMTKQNENSFVNNAIIEDLKQQRETFFNSTDEQTKAVEKSSK